MFCTICLFGSLLSPLLEEDICQHDSPLIAYTIRQYGFENPLRIFLLGITNRDEKRAWKKSPINGRRYRLKRNKQLKHPSIKFHNQWYNLGHILKGDSAISCEFRDSMKFLARNQIRFDSRNAFHDHIQAHNLNFIRSTSQFENVYNRCLIQTTQNIQFGDSLSKITKTFYKFLSNYSFRLPPRSRTVNLMTYAYYIKNSFKFIE